MTEPRPLRLFEDNGVYYIVAHSAGDAEHLFRDAIGVDSTFNADTWTLVPGDEQISIGVYRSGPQQGQIASADEMGEPLTEPLTLSADDWVTREGRGFLCATEY